MKTDLQLFLFRINNKLIPKILCFQPLKKYLKKYGFI